MDAAVGSLLGSKGVSGSCRKVNPGVPVDVLMMGGDGLPGMDQGSAWWCRGKVLVMTRRFLGGCRGAGEALGTRRRLVGGCHGSCEVFQD
jgi:hypothetical protein